MYCNSWPNPNYLLYVRHTLGPRLALFFEVQVIDFFKFHPYFVRPLFLSTFVSFDLYFIRPYWPSRVMLTTSTHVSPYFAKVFAIIHQPTHSFIYPVVVVAVLLLLLCCCCCWRCYWCCCCYCAVVLIGLLADV